MIPLVDVKAQYAPLIPALKERVGEVIDSGRFILGPNVAAFEEEVAAYLGVPETIGVANGTDALVLALDAMEIGPGDEVICPSFTFYATCEAIAKRGATPVFADIELETMNLDPEDVAERITPKTKAIMPVHLFGRMARHAELAELGPPIIEDAAQAFGAPDVATVGVALHVQLLPDQEPVRDRRRRPGRRDRRGAGASASGCSASTARATRSTSSWSATTRASTRSRPLRCACSCPSSRAGTAPVAKRPRVTPSSVWGTSATYRPTTAGTSSTCTSSAARNATGSPRR